jgi:hypothetical protein
MGHGSNKLIVAILRPPLLVLRFFASRIYKIFFGRADRNLAIRHQDELAQAIRNQLAFLFEEHHGAIVPNVDVRFPPEFDYAYVTVSVGDLLFRFLRGRGELSAEVRHGRTPHEWHDLSTVLSLVDPTEKIQRGPFDDLGHLGGLLRPHMNRLQNAFSTDGYPELKKQLSRVYAHDQAATRQLQTEINRRLYD